MKRTNKLLFSADDATAIRTVVPPSSIAPRMPRRHTVAVALLVAVLLLGAAWLVFAQSDEQVNVWRGVTDRGQVAVTLTLASSQDAKLAFGAPRFCTLTARLETGDDYSLRDSNGGYCDRLLGGHMKLTVNTDTAQLHVQLTDDKSAVRDTAELGIANRTDDQPPSN